MDVGAVKAAHRLSAVVGEVVALRGDGRELRGLCPFHEERTPSFTVNDEAGFFHCFGCNAHGDVIDFVQRTKGIGFQEAADALAERAGHRHGPPERRPSRRVDTGLIPIVPVPATAATLTHRHHQHGEPSSLFTYRDGEGRVLGHVARFNVAGGKAILPRVYTAAGWRWQSFGKPRPLYHLEALVARPEANVVVVEGEGVADAAASLFPQAVAVTWPGGAAAVKHADWSPLRGRKVVVVPDRDEPGRRAAQEVMAALDDIAAAVRLALPPVGPDDGWDLGDAHREGWTPEQALGWLRSAVSTVEPSASPSVAESPVGPVEVLWDFYALDRPPKKAPVANVDNAVRVLERDPCYETRFHYDVFAGRIMSSVDTPVREHADVDDVALALDLQRRVGLRQMTAQTCHQAVQVMAHRRRRDPLRDYLEGLAWDRVERIHDFFPDAFGAENTEYARRVGANFLIGLVARGLEPGCKLDTMPVAEGPQGIKKSSAFRALVPYPAWFAEIMDSPENKELYLSIQGKWIVEIAELDAFNRADVAAVKRMLSCQSDRFREPWGRSARDWPRRCVLVGTTNRDDWGRDDTGARRFWPVRCASIDMNYITTMRDQLFAEAVERYRAGESWWEMPLVATAAEQNERRQTDPWEEVIATYADVRPDVTVPEILTGPLRIDIGRVTKSDQMRVASCLRVLGYQRIDGRLHGKRQKFWHRPWEQVGTDVVTRKND